ncbi:UvrD-helicase domain-containing protein [Christiangramia fulva]
MNFEVELETDEILAEAVDSLISKAGSDKKLTSVLLDFTLNKTDDDKSWDISRDLFIISKLLTNENNQRAIAVLKEKTLDDFREYEINLNKKLRATKEAIRETADEFFEIMRENSLDDSDFSGKYLVTHFKKLKNGDELKFDAKWIENLNDKPLYPKRVDKEKQILLDALQPKISELFDQAKKLYYKAEYYQEIGRNLVQLSLLNEINKEIDAIKKERNMMLISEFNPKISEQVKDQPAPFIYERLGERYRHYFIDEFQDTSVMQWENLIPLIDHNLSGKEENAGLTLVGDAKQSIYRWRGGRAEQLIGLSSNQINPFQIDANVVNLPDNYRSGSTIVNFNNSFFAYASEKISFPAYAELFKNSRQTPKTGDFGYVNIEFIEAASKEEETEKYPQQILESILELDNDGFDRGDICILTRTRDQGALVAEFLSQHEISVVSSETLLLKNSAEVNFIISVLSLLLKEEDRLLKFEVFDYLSSKYLKEEAIFESFLQNIEKTGRSFYEWLEEYEIHFDPEFLKRQSLYEGVEYIIRSFKLVEKPDAYLQFFLDFVFEVSQKHSSAYSSLLEKWEQKKHKLSIVTPESSGAVQIMTIHKSKGLEFPVVIYPFANSDLQDTRKDCLWLNCEDELIPIAYVNASSKMLNWDDDAAQAYTQLVCQNELDTLNVFYVACTRASERLYVLSNYNEKPKKNPNIPDMLLEFANREKPDSQKRKVEFGMKEGPKQQKEQKENVRLAETFYSSAVQNQAVNIVTRAGALWDSTQQEAIEKGEIIHEVLSKIDHSEDLEAAMDWAVVNGLIMEASRQEISTIVSKIINHTQLSHYYSKDSENFNEREIISPNGERLRPDRLNFRGKKVTIIDYKTGGFVDDHEKQILGYASVLKEMNFEIDQCLLVYTHDPVIIRIVKEN